MPVFHVPPFSTAAAAAWLVAMWSALSWAAPAAVEGGAEGARYTDLKSVRGPSAPGFFQLEPATTGIFFTNELSDARSAENQIRLIGSGVAAGDVDGDGWCDLYFCGLENSNRLYRNRGDWSFEERTEKAGVSCAGQFSTGAALADVDGDEDADLLVNSIGGGTRLFLNNGGGQFAEKIESGLVTRGCATSMALADFDGDGDLDLYVANYRTSTIRSTGLSVLNVNGRRMLRPQDRDQYEITPEGLIIEHAEPDMLYRNIGGARFAPVPWTQGYFADEAGRPLTRAPRDWGLSVQFRDMNSDGWPDLYVCNDFGSPDRIWINVEGRQFRALGQESIRSTSTFSMGVDFADINRDGFDDIFVLDMLSPSHQRRMVQMSAGAGRVADAHERPQVERNTLHLNRGDGTYAEVAQLSGLDATEWSWAAAFIDVDLDGFEDVLVTTGHAFDTQDADAEERMAALGPRQGSIGESILQYPRLELPNRAYWNQRDLTFRDMSREWGFAAVGVSHGLALADLDNDGDLDAAINNLNRPASVYRNETTAPRVAVRLRGQGGNSAGVGAKIWYHGGTVVQSQEMLAGGRYLSSDAPERVFSALSEPSGRLEVVWRNGKRSVLTDVRPNRRYVISEAGAAAAPSSAVSTKPAAWFQDLTAKLQHTHRDAPFDAAAEQMLLSRQLCHFGPGISWYDLDEDGWDDLFIGSGRGGRLGAFRNDSGRGFVEFAAKAFQTAVTRDQTTILGFHGRGRSAGLLIGSSNYEDGLAVGACVRGARLESAALEEIVGAQPWSVGPMTLADCNADGELDLFVAGRCVPGKYAQPASGLLYRGRGGKWELDQANSARFTGLGLISSAIFTDWNGDGWPDLVLACDWGPVRLFENNRGDLTEVTSSVGLGKFTGWWNGVAAGDFNGDGRMDLVASNWGRNTPYTRHLQQPLRVWAGDFDANGTWEHLEAGYDAELQRFVPGFGRHMVAAALPDVAARFQTHASFGRATVEEIIGPSVKRAKTLEAAVLDTMVFLNAGDHFVPGQLPIEAQFAPGFGLAVADFNGDGSEDFFMSQNFFRVGERLSPFDAGLGLMMFGNGRGEFRAVPAAESGLRLLGEQRGCATADFDQDGRVDLAVGQNSGATGLFRNAGASPGLRVRLTVSGAGDGAVGAVVRAHYENGQVSAARELSAGSGFWSQQSLTTVLPAPWAVTELSIRWPGGKAQQVRVPSGAREFHVEAQSAGL